MGRSQPVDGQAMVLCQVGPPADSRPAGLLSPSGHIWGTYLHGLFDNDALRHAWLHSLGWSESGELFDRHLAYNRLADHIQANVDMAALEQIIWGTGVAGQ